MKEYLLLFRGGDAGILQQSPEKWQSHMQKWMDWMSELSNSGKLISAQPLANTGKQIAGKHKQVTDGPFVEAKEIVGGYLMCKAEGYDQAVDIAKNCPLLDFDDGIVEVREIREM